MGCGLSTKKKLLGPCKPHIYLVNRMELDLLELMFEDLAKRSRLGTIEKDTFLTFFHLNVILSLYAGFVGRGDLSQLRFK